MAVDHDRIAQLLGEEEVITDHSLRAKSLQRATTASVPRTLTPYEWEQWYAQHGVPESHINHAPVPKRSWWRRLLKRKHQGPACQPYRREPEHKAGQKRGVFSND